MKHARARFSSGWAFLAAFCFCCSASAQTKVGLNFVGGSTVNGTPVGLSPNEVAGYVPQQFWNNGFNSAGSINLEGSANGDSFSVHFSGFTATWSDNFGTRSTPIAETPGNARLMKGYLNADNSASGTATLNVTDVPSVLTNAHYAVVVYVDGDNRTFDRVAKVTLTAAGFGTKTLYALDKANSDFAGQFKTAPPSSVTDQGSATPDGNVLIFGPLSDNAFNLTVSGGSASDGNSRGALNAIQIVDARLVSLPTQPELDITPVNSGTTNQLNSGSLLNSQVGIVAGANGMLLVTKDAGATWAAVSLGRTNNLTSVRLVDTRLFVFGENGFIASSDDFGGSWTFYPPLAGISWYASSFWDANSGLVVGASGQIQRFTSGSSAATWSSEVSGVASDLRAVATVGTTAYAVGADGVILRHQNGAWVRQDSGVTETFYAVQFLDENFGFVAGANGIVCRTVNGGLTWEKLNSGVSSALRAAVILSQQIALAAGDNGIVIETLDGGKTWNAVPSGTMFGIYGLAFADGRGFFFGQGGMIFRFESALIPVNQPPTVAVTTPLNRAEALACRPFAITAAASDPDGFIRRVEFFAGPMKIGETTATPYSLRLISRVPGEYVLIARAIDNSGAVSLSAPVTITVVPPPVRVLQADGFGSQGEFQFCFQAELGKSYAIEATVEWASWTRIGTVSGLAGIVRFNDPDANKFPRRFYRLIQL